MDNRNEPEIKSLVWNESFRKWVLESTPELDAFWDQYLQENPWMAPVLSQARNIVLALRVEDTSASSQEIKQIVAQTIQKIELKDISPAILSRRPNHWFRQWWINSAAVFLIVAGVGWLVSTWLIHSPNSSIYTDLVSAAPDKLVEKVNTSLKPQKLPLPDGSRVTLQKNSRVSYMPRFEGPVREVYLSGEAFFEVVKDPSHPFIVHANGIVTKVLGTSFTVRAYENNPQVVVEVKTGKVSVALGENPGIKEKATHREREGVVLTPNQKMVFSREDIRMTKLLIDQPVITVPASTAGGFNFDDTPAAQVFATLEKAYSVDIVYDEDLLRQCPLTAAFTHESLFEKLNSICRAIEAEYEVIDGQIVIYSKGCNR